MDNVTIFTLIAAAGTICGIVFGYIGYSKGAKKDSYQNGEQDSTLKSDTQYIKRRVDDVLLEQRNINNTLSSHSERITRVEESSKQAHKRIDHIEQHNEAE